MSHGSRNPSAHLDAHGPFVFDVRPLGRRPGSQRAEHRTVSAPAGFGVELVGVREGADVELDIRLEAVMEGVLVTGTARAPLTGECARCLDPLTSGIEVEFQELFCYLAVRERDGEVTEEDHYLDGDLLDLEPVCRDAIVLALPLSPLCSGDCPGLCVECGVRLADVGPGHGHGDGADPRWAALRLLDTADTAARTGRDHADEGQES
ncbi:MAG: YceD family protein [Micromonosporaceae bacterium]